MRSRIISRDSEQLLRAVLRGKADSIMSGDLVNRLMRCGCSRGEAHQLISSAAACGLLERLTTKLPHQYVLNTQWQREQKPVNAHAGKSATPLPSQADCKTKAYVGPVFECGASVSLAPDFGTVCGSLEEAEGELPPAIGTRLCDALHDQFIAEFGHVEHRRIIPEESDHEQR